MKNVEVYHKRAELVFVVVTKNSRVHVYVYLSVYLTSFGINRALFFDNQSDLFYKFG